MLPPPWMQQRRAATLIQSYYRGHRVRDQWSKIYSVLVMRREMRADLREYLKGNRLVLQGAEYKKRRHEVAHLKAIVIQSAYRRLLSYRACERKRLIRLTDRRRDAAIKIQSLIRIWRSKMLVRKLRERLWQERRHKACTR